MSDWQVRIVNDITTVAREQWDALVGEESPFLEWDWLASLEESGCVRAERGWAPHHLVAESEGKLVAACPLYLKGNSEGEFVFDHEWAYAAQGADIDYYPKLLVAVPFTPANGMRFLTAPGAPRAELLRLLGEVLKQVCAQNEISSVHVNFCRPDEVAALRELGYLERVGLQYHWENHGYANFEDYLAAFRSKRRTKIRHERKALAEQGVTIRALTGDDIPEDLVPTVYRLYKEHIDQLYWGRLYLNPEFFRLVHQRCRRNLCFVVAEREGQVIAGTFNVQKRGVFYGRYWGAFEELPFLHFNVCYYAAIEHCIAGGLQRMEPGAGGDFKQLRGFDPRPTHSMHFFTNPALRQAVDRHLQRERERMGLVIEHLNGQSQLKIEVREAEG